MSIDREAAIATTIAPYTTTVERGRLQFFALSTGEEAPVYLDLDAARAAGHRDLPVPPTFFFSLELDAGVLIPLLDDLGVDLRRVLHGEQRFDYHALAHAGDELTLTPRITDVYAKRGGALEFIVKETEVTREGEPIATAVTTLVVQNPEVSA